MVAEDRYRQRNGRSRLLRSKACGGRYRGQPGRPVKHFTSAVAPEADVSDGHGQPLAPPRAIDNGGTSLSFPRTLYTAHEGWGSGLTGASCTGQRSWPPGAVIAAGITCGLRLPSLTAAGALHVSIATAFSQGGPRRRGCPVAPAAPGSLAEGGTVKLGVGALRGCCRARRPVGQGQRAADAGGPAVGWGLGPAERALSWRGGPGRGRRPLLPVQVRAAAPCLGRRRFV